MLEDSTTKQAWNEHEIIPAQLLLKAINNIYL